MTKEEFYAQIAVDPFNFKLREELLVHFQYDRVFVNGQKWQIKNGKCPSSLNGINWYWYDANYILHSCLERELFKKLNSSLLISSYGTKYKQYSSLVEAEIDLAQALEKLRKPLIIQLTSTGFEVV